MADIGGSTAAHISRHEINYPAGHECLDNWSAWYRSSDDGTRGSIVQPMFREYMAGYREASELRSLYDEDYALECDRMMAKYLKAEEVDVVFIHYVHARPSRAAAKELAVSVNEYRLRLESVIARVDMLLQFIEKSA